MARFIELSHQIREGMETYRLLPVPRVEVLNDYDASRYDGKAEFDAVATGMGRLHAPPIAWVGGATFPVRAYVVAE